MSQYCMVLKIRFWLLTHFKTNLLGTLILGESFWRVSRFAWLSQKMVLYLSTKFGILKHWSSIQSLRTFDLGFLQASKQFYRKLQYREIAFEEFQGLSRFPRKMVLYSSTKFGILKSWSKIQAFKMDSVLLFSWTACTR